MPLTHTHTHTHGYTGDGRTVEVAFTGETAIATVKMVMYISLTPS